MIMTKYISDTVDNKIKNKFNEWIDQDLNNSRFRSYKRSHKNLAKEFDQKIFNFYDNKLSKFIQKITLSPNLKKEIYCFNWVSEKGQSFFLANINKIQEKLYLCNSNFYNNMDYYYLLITQNKMPLSLIYNDLIANWESLLIKKILDYKLHVINVTRQKFMIELFDSIEIINKFNKVLYLIFNFFGNFWEINEEQIQKMNPKAIETTAKYFETDPVIYKIAKLLGRFHKISDLIEERVYEKIILENQWLPLGNWPEEIRGLSESNDLEHVYPLELSYFFNEKLKLIFLRKFIERKLIVFDYVSDEIVPVEKLSYEMVQSPIPNEKGPFIICVDSSGSMQGIPETIAKAITLAIIKIAVKENRDCFLFNFSNFFHGFDLTNISYSLPNLLRFLQFRFNGNTDIEPVVIKMCSMLDYDEYFNADILIISDFGSADFSKTTVEMINSLKQRRNRFFGLCIGQIGNKKILSHLTDYWFYDPADPLTAEKIVVAMESKFMSVYDNYDFK